MHEVWREGLCFGVFEYTSAGLLPEVWSLRIVCYKAFWEDGYGLAVWEIALKDYVRACMNSNKEVNARRKRETS